MHQGSKTGRGIYGCSSLAWYDGVANEILCVNTISGNDYGRAIEQYCW